MKAIICHTALVCTLCLFLLPAQAQQTRAFNQNASRSNHTRLGVTAFDPWSVGLNTGASFSAKSGESNLFRGNSMATKILSSYYFDQLGLGLSMGIIPGSIDKKDLNSFIDQRKLRTDNLQVRKVSPFNSYLLAGPSFRFGNRVIVSASLQGGLFFNDPGAVSIAQQQGPDIQELYGFMAAEQKLFPGFSGSFQIAYPLGKNTGLFINADYLQSRNSIRILDVNGGIPTPLTQNRNLQMITTGIGIIKNFGGTGRSAARRQYKPATAGPAMPEAYNATSSCGPVTHRITHPDGSTEVLEFTCPDDAAAYALRMSQGDTQRIRQTQGQTFGEPIRGLSAAAGSSDPDTSQTRAQNHNSTRSNRSTNLVAQPLDTMNTSQQKAQDHNSSRSNKSASISEQPGDTTNASQQKAQDHNSSRSNKSASISEQPGNSGSGAQEKAQDHNSSRSNKTTSIASPTPTPDSTKQVQDHNSSRSNKSSAIDAPDPGNGSTNKAQNHNVTRSNRTSNITSPTPDSIKQVQDHNSSRSNKSSAIDAPDPGNGSTNKAQDHNSSRSNKTASSVSVDADLDGDGVYETDLTQTLKDEIRIDEKGELVEMPSQKAGVSTSRSNIRSHAKLQAIGNNLYLCHATAEIDKKLVPVKIIYK